MSVCVLCVVCMAVDRGDTCVSEPQGRLSAGHVPMGPMSRWARAWLSLGPASCGSRASPALSAPARSCGDSRAPRPRAGPAGAMAMCRAVSTVAAAPPLWSLPGARGVGVVDGGPQPAWACSGRRSWGCGGDSKQRGCLEQSQADSQETAPATAGWGRRPPARDSPRWQRGTEPAARERHRFLAWLWGDGHDGPGLGRVRTELWLSLLSRCPAWGAGAEYHVSSDTHESPTE